MKQTLIANRSLRNPLQLVAMLLEEYQGIRILFSAKPYWYFEDEMSSTKLKSLQESEEKLKNKNLFHDKSHWYDEDESIAAKIKNEFFFSDKS